MPGRTISIHAPREGGDERQADAQNLRPRDFNPRPPRGGRRSASSGGAFVQAFQSTPPARGATSGKPTLKIYDLVISIHAPREGGDVLQVAAVHLFKHFNPRPPRGGRPHVFRPLPGLPVISIHAPREGGDDYMEQGYSEKEAISIHAPREGGDCGGFPDGCVLKISIHAPREGGDI